MQWIFRAPEHNPGMLSGFQEIIWVAPKNKEFSTGKFPKFSDFAQICAKNSQIQFTNGIPEEEICGVSYKMI